MKILLITFLITFAGLNKSCKKSGEIFREGSVEITLHQCADGIISGDQFRLCFDSLISDSRCPANAVCIWQGTATCKFSFAKNNESHQFNLSTISIPGQYTKDTTLLGYKIEFINLSPYPGTQPAPVPDNQIKAEMKITKL